MNNAPSYLSEVAETSATFPIDWKESYFRLNLDRKRMGYECPMCGNLFCGPKGFNELHGDHIHPRARGGRTVWSNLQLLCGPCNLQKSSHIMS